MASAPPAGQSGLASMDLGSGPGLTVELRPAARHEELDGLNLGQVTVLVLLLRVAVRPVVKQERR